MSLELTGAFVLGADFSGGVFMTESDTIRMHANYNADRPFA